MQRGGAVRVSCPPDAMQVATVDELGVPRVRTVLARQVDEAGLVFYANLGSRKALALLDRPVVAGVFHWKSLERQVLVQGRARQVSAREADAYFASRPRGSQLGAWASAQSRPLASRAELDARIAAEAERFEGRDVARPPFWGGFRIVPDRWEFWQGRADGVHDRFEFVPDGAGWARERLMP